MGTFPDTEIDWRDESLTVLVNLFSQKTLLKVIGAE